MVEMTLEWKQRLEGEMTCHWDSPEDWMQLLVRHWIPTASHWVPPEGKMIYLWENTILLYFFSFIIIYLLVVVVVVHSYTTSVNPLPSLKIFFLL